jgi:di/tricarboxylate transporter
VEVSKKRGVKVIRVKVTKHSRLIGRTAAEVQFRETYKAAIVVVQQDGRNATDRLSSLKFKAHDILVLQVSEDCPLLFPSTAITSSNSNSFRSSLSARFNKSSDKVNLLGVDENAPPNIMERSDVEAGDRNNDAASSTMVCEIVSTLLVHECAGFIH